MCQALPIFSELETFRSKEDFILATLQQVDIRENTFQKGASLSGKRSRYANTKQLKWWEGRKEGRGDCGSMQTMFYRADIFLPAQDSDETIINRCRVQFNCSCISNQPREKVLITLEQTFQASSLQIGCNNSKNLDLTSDPPGFRRASFVNIADRFPITLENPTFSNNFPDIALPKKSFGVCQLRRAFQLLSQPDFSPASFSNGPSSICALGKFSNNLSLKCGLNSPNNLSTKSSIISHPNFPNNILSVSSLDRTQTFKLS